MLRRKVNLCALLFLSALNQNIFAETLDQNKTFSYSITPLASIRVGMDSFRTNKSSSVLLAPSAIESNLYVPSANWKTSFVGGAFLGFEMSMPRLCFLRWQTGAAYYSSDNVKIPGVVEVFSDPALTDLNYEYKIKNQRIVWENKGLINLTHGSYFYLLSGIGGAYNKAYDYHETQRSSQAAINKPFNSHSQWKFMYELGFGLETDVTQQIRLGLGYQYVNLNKIKLEPQTGQLTNQSIQYRYYANEFIANISYLF